MKILMTLEGEFPPDIRVENEIEALSAAGHEVHIACLTHINRVAFEKLKGYTIHRKSISKFYYKTSVGALRFNIYFKFWERYLNTLFKDEKFEVLHVHDLPLLKLGVKLRAIYGFKLVVDLHENWPALLSLSEHTKKPLGKLLCSIPQWIEYEKEQVPKADHVIVVVDEARERLIRLKVVPDKITVVSNTLNANLFNFPPQDPLPGKFIMVYGGGVNYHRGLQLVIGALPELELKIREIELWIIGSGRYLEQLKAMAEQLKVSHLVNFMGWQPQDKLLKLFSQSNLALIPHIKSEHTDNTIPHKLFQYMYAGIPIISSDCDPLQRIITETQSGLVFKDGSSADFILNVMRVYNGEANLDHKKAKDTVISKYNWIFDAKRLLSVYEC